MKSLELKLDKVLKALEKSDSKKGKSSNDEKGGSAGPPTHAGHMVSRVMLEDFARRKMLKHRNLTPLHRILILG